MCFFFFLESLSGLLGVWKAETALRALCCAPSQVQPAAVNSAGAACSRELRPRMDVG